MTTTSRAVCPNRISMKNYVEAGAEFFDVYRRNPYP